MFENEGLDGVPARAGEAAAALSALKGPAEDAAKAIEAAFARAGDSLAGSLTRAAADGKVTLDELAAAAIRAFAVFARSGGFEKGGLAGALEAAVGGLFGGARAGGGPIVGGGAYLVGERGPEVFRPTGAGEVQPLGGGTTVNVRVEAAASGGGGVLRSEAQIAQAIARAAMLGARRL